MSTYLIVFPTIERLSLANAEPVQTKVQSISINNGVSRYWFFKLEKKDSTAQEAKHIKVNLSSD
jgi:hypothetical protein